MAEQVQYAKSDGRYIAYQTVGEGERDLLFINDAFGNLDLQWDEPALARTLRRLSQVGRLIMINRRGIGLSDALPGGEEPSLGAWQHDIVTVLDEIGSTSTAILATGGAGPVAIQLAATEPSRVSALVLLGAWASLRRADDYPFGMTDELLDIVPQEMERIWGTGELMLFGAPDRAQDQRLRDWYARMERHGATPRVAAEVQRMLVGTDVRSLLGQVRSPTLVIHREDDPIVPLAFGRYISAHIADARFLALSGSAHLCFGDSPLEWLEEVRQLLTGSRMESVAERVLRTMLFTDIVGSTEYAATVGDERWHETLTRYEEALASEIVASGGILVDSQGDGHLATFERPFPAIRCAQRIGRVAEELGIGVRCGLHTGEVELYGDDLAGLAVHLASRVADQANASEVYVSRTVVDLVIGSDVEFVSIGERELKGVPGSWHLYSVIGS